MEPLSAFLIFSAITTAVQVGTAVWAGSDDRPKPRLRVRKCWVCCGTARYQGQTCPECRGSGLS